MDFRAVLIPLCVLFTQALCTPVGSRDSEEARNSSALNETISMALNKIQTARDHLDVALPEPSCSFKEDVGLKQQPLSARRLSKVHCFMQKLSKLTPEVPEILIAAQFIKDAGHGLNSWTTPQNCSLPEFKEGPKAYEFALCFLDRVLEERPS